MTLVSARPIREHVLRLRAAGGTYETIARAAGTGAMTVHCIAKARRPKVQAGVARRLLAINENDIRSMHPSVGGTMWRLRALVAMGHSCSRMAAATGTPPATLRRIVRGEALTISPQLRQLAVALFDAWWDKTPPRRTRQEKLAATNALRRAALYGWPCPAGLDDDELDQPGYRPTHGWKAALGTGTVTDIRYPAPPRNASPANRTGRSRPPVGQRKDPAMTQQQERDPSPPQGTRLPAYVVELWVSEQLRDRVQRDGRSLAEALQAVDEQADPGEPYPEVEP
jgi:hypothetical protein